MKDKVFHESSQSDDNNEVLNRRSRSGVALFHKPAGEFRVWLCISLHYIDLLLCIGGRAREVGGRGESYGPQTKIRGDSTPLPPYKTILAEYL